jgi:hypothetical protein
MAEGGIVLVDGKRTKIHYHTGLVTVTRKQREGQLPSGAAGSPSASTADHHELHIVDDAGRERVFNMIDMDIGVREGNRVTVVWVVPEDVQAGPHIAIYNHDTRDRTGVTPERIAAWFMQPKKVVWGSTLALVLASLMLSWLLVAVSLFAPFLYFKRRARNAVRGLFASPELAQLEARLLQAKSTTAAAA